MSTAKKAKTGDKSKANVRACDGCRRKKIKCDGVYPKACSHCRDAECTYDATEPKKFYNVQYVESLEQELARYREIAGGIDTSTSSTLKRKNDALDHSSRVVPAADWRDLRDEELSKDIDGLYVPSDLSEKRFYGKASLRGLFERLFIYTKLDPQTLISGGKRRDEVWVDDWNDELSATQQRPDDATDLTEDVALVDHLVGVYFDLVNVTFPLLNELHFKTDLHSRKQHRPFRNVLLLVCALGAVFSDDERVLVAGRRHLRFLAGWRFYNEARLHLLLPDRLLSRASTLEDIQALILMQIYIQKGVQTKCTWMTHGLTILLVQNQGLHLSWLNAKRDNHEQECRKRAIWMLYILDRAHTACFGRPLLLKDEEMYLDLPARFGCESAQSELSLVFVREYLKICKIHGKVIQNLYKYRRSNSGEDLALTVTELAALNRALHQWRVEVPELLSLDGSAHSVDELTHQLRCVLRIAHSSVQIFMHKPFMVYPHRDAPPSAFQTKSLMVCANAARDILTTCKDIFLDRRLSYYWHDCGFDWAPLSATIILVLSCCEARRHGEFFQSDIAYIKCGVQVLRTQEHRNQLFARAVDIVVQVLRAARLLEDGDDFLDVQESLSGVFGGSGGGNSENDISENNTSDAITSHDMLEFINSASPHLGTNDFSLDAGGQSWSNVIASMLAGGTGDL